VTTMKTFLLWAKRVLLGTIFAYILFRMLQSGVPNFEKLQKQRNAVAVGAWSDIRIAVAWEVQDYNKTYLDGIKLAVDHLNASGGIKQWDADGKEFHRQIRYKVYTDDPHTAARKIVKDPRFMAVIGHETSGMAIPASITYQDGGLLFIAPTATHPELTLHDFDLVFRPAPDDAEMIRGIVDQARVMGISNAAVLSARNTYGLSLARLFEDVSGDENMTITFNTSYSETCKDFRQLAYQMKEKSFGCVILADTVPRAATVIMQLREQHINVPILGADGLDDVTQLRDIARDASEGTYVASSYVAPSGTNLAQRLAGATTEMERLFLTVCDSKNMIPDAYAAVEVSHTTVPLVVASTLKYEGPWQGLMGAMKFDERGNVVGKKVTMKVVKNGQFQKVSRGDKP
jgi:branched-chain amino acid transport system substrate-binding protein